MEPQRRAQPFTAMGRRAFLQLGGSSLLILGVAPLPLGCGSDADTETPRPPWRMLVADPALCGGCARCAITCAAMLGEPFTPNRSLVGPDRVHHEYVAHNERKPV
jgi:hypothetical protein